MLTTFIGEEPVLEILDVLLKLNAKTCIKAVNHILFQVTEDAEVRVTVLVVRARQETVYLAPRLTLRVLCHEAVKKFA